MVERAAFIKFRPRLVKKSGAPTIAVGHSMPMALLTWPHFIYKSESPELTGVKLYHCLSHFLRDFRPGHRSRPAIRRCKTTFASEGGVGVYSNRNPFNLIQTQLIISLDHKAQLSMRTPGFANNSLSHYLRVNDFQSGN